MYGLYLRRMLLWVRTHITILLKRKKTHLSVNLRNLLFVIAGFPSLVNTLLTVCQCLTQKNVNT